MNVRMPLAVWMWAMALAPVAWLLAFALFILRARLSLGRWPVPYQPDPKDLGFDYHYALLVAGMPIMFAAVIAVTALTPLVHRLVVRPWMVPFVGLVGLAAAVLLAHLDPGRVFTWLAD